jgi:hypothetical protein
MKTNDKVWYACYGSNLKAKRFECYIIGGYCPCNGKYYRGCTDKTMWAESKTRNFNGELYFGNESRTWGGNGVAYYDPEKTGTVIMRLYLITWGQLLDVQKQEGKSSSWYGRLVSLGNEDGIPVYTFTSEFRHEFNPPSDKYLAVIRDGLVNECGVSENEAGAYLASALMDKTV